MKIALRYGLIITAGVAAWTIVAHTLIPNPKSAIHSVGAFTFFNVLHFSGVYLGIKALEREKRQKPTFKEGLKQGVLISAVYAVSVSLFFAGTLLVIGPKWMATEAMDPAIPMSRVAVQAFAGLTLLTVFFGLIYSTLISFALAKRLSES